MELPNRWWSSAERKKRDSALLDGSIPRYISRGVEGVRDRVVRIIGSEATTSATKDLPTSSPRGLRDFPEVTRGFRDFREATREFREVAELAREAPPHRVFPQAIKTVGRGYMFLDYMIPGNRPGAQTPPATSHAAGHTDSVVTTVSDRAVIAVYCHLASYIASFRAIARILQRSGADKVFTADDILEGRATLESLSLEPDDVGRYGSFFHDLDAHHKHLMKEAGRVIHGESGEGGQLPDTVSDDVVKFQQRLAELRQRGAPPSQVAAHILDTLERAHDGLREITGITASTQP